MRIPQILTRPLTLTLALLAGLASGCINGFGAGSYILGLEAAILHNKAND